MKNYSATDKDLRTIENGIRHVWHPKLDFIFKDKQKIKNVVVVSYDSDFLYVYKHKNNPVNVNNATKLTTALENYDLFKIHHKIRVDKNDLLGWAAGFLLNDKFPSDKIFRHPKGDTTHFQIISGSLITQFLIEQIEKTKQMPLNPYITYESYLATIVHEFGHAYYNNFRTWWYFNKDENINYLQSALKLYRKEKVGGQPQVNFPNYDKRSTLLSELFAFCTDYLAASIFWNKHMEDIDRANIVELKNLIKIEEKKNLFQENSVLDPNPAAHTAALTIGKILVTKFPKTWPEKILSLNYSPL